MTRKLTIPCSKSKLADIRTFVNDILMENHMPELESHKIVLAIDEVCANLIIHSNNCDPGERLELLVDFRKGDQVSFVIRDRGVSFDLSRYQEPSMDEIIASKRKGGLGLMLVKRIMDKIEFTTENNYNICRLIKKL
ncbi:MAG: ATP-binding protein [Bacteroidota bacterium]